MTFEEDKEGLGLAMPETATEQRWGHNGAQAKGAECTLGWGGGDAGQGVREEGGPSGAAVEVPSMAKRGLCGNFGQQMVSEETLVANRSGL